MARGILDRDPFAMSAVGAKLGQKIIGTTARHSARVRRLDIVRDQLEGIWNGRAASVAAVRR